MCKRTASVGGCTTYVVPSVDPDGPYGRASGFLYGQIDGTGHSVLTQAYLAIEYRKGRPLFLDDGLGIGIQLMVSGEKMGNLHNCRPLTELPE